MRCDVLAQGVVDAAKEINLSVPLVVRLAGTNFEKGKEILSKSKLTKIPEGIPVYDISSGKFIVRQGNIVKEYVSETIEE